jgi:hypothetical protein
MGLVDRTLWGEGGFEARAREIEDSLGEPIRESWNANHIEHGRQVGGRLVLTDSRLLFYPSKLESGAALGMIRTIATVSPDAVSGRVFKREGSIWSAELGAIEEVDTTWMIRTYLRVHVEDGAREEFLANGIKKAIIPAIQAAMA